jgi:SNF2 family DNA or RNA helicase
MLDILQWLMYNLQLSYVRLDGNTQVRGAPYF